MGIRDDLKKLDEVESQKNQAVVDKQKKAAEDLNRQLIEIGDCLGKLVKDSEVRTSKQSGLKNGIAEMTEIQSRVAAEIKENLSKIIDDNAVLHKKIAGLESASKRKVQPDKSKLVLYVLAGINMIIMLTICKAVFNISGFTNSVIGFVKIMTGLKLLGF